MKPSILILCFSILPVFSFAQLGFKESQELTFKDVNLKKFSTVGGLDNPQFSEIDLNNDGILDLFVFDRKFDVIRTFIYNENDSSYQYAPSFESVFPSGIHDFVLLRDFNCDGFQDLFTYFQGGFRVYQNDGVFPISFSLKESKIQTKYGQIKTSAFVLAGDVPAIVDIDNDGDLDLLTFGTVASENTIEFNRNLSMDLYGNCDSLEFEVETQCWGNVVEPANQIFLEAASCRGIVPPPPFEERGARIHPGSSILLVDIDNDGDKDLMLGDIASSSFVRSINTGDSSSANIDIFQQSAMFPSVQNPANIQYQVSGYEIDVDHDGIKDLLLSVNNSIDSSVNVNQVWYYRNTLPEGANYELITKEFLSSEMIDLGSSVIPNFIDINDDGLKDLLLAVDFRRDNQSFKRSRIYAYTQNAGGEFELANENYANLSLFNLNSISPALGDLDNDGDLDMIIGAGDGFLHLVKNNTLGFIPDFQFTTPNYMNINTIGSNAAPTLGDVNGDGLLDIVVGERTGVLSYFENIGTAISPLFESSPTIDSFGKIDISNFCCTGFSAPRFIENETAFGPGKFLFVGSDEKDIEVYRIGPDLGGAFNRADSIFVNSGKVAPLLDDIDNDGIIELIVGTGEGGIKFYDRAANTNIGIKTIQHSAELSVYPNPNSGLLHVSGIKSDSEFKLIDISGKVVMRGKLSQRLSEIALDQLQNGHYILIASYYKPVPVVLLR